MRAEPGGAPLLSIVVPSFNEAESLRELTEGVHEYAQAYGYELIFVDDGSTDESWELMQQLAREYPTVGALRLRKNFGKGMALASGFHQARGQILMTMDADLQDDPAEIPKFIERVQMGDDVVVGWRVKRLDPKNRLVLTCIFNAIVPKITGVRLRDMNCGFKAYRRDVIETVPIYGDLFRFTPALAVCEGFKISEVPVHHRARKHGTSRYGPERIMRGSFDFLSVLFLTKYARRPMHLFGLLGLVLGSIGICIDGYLTVLWAYGEPIGTRPLLLLGTLLIIGSIQFFSMGFLGELLTYLHQKRATPRDLPIRETVRPGERPRPTHMPTPTKDAMEIMPS